LQILSNVQSICNRPFRRIVSSDRRPASGDERAKLRATETSRAGRPRSVSVEAPNRWFRGEPIGLSEPSLSRRGPGDRCRDFGPVDRHANHGVATASDPLVSDFPIRLPGQTQNRGDDPAFAQASRHFRLTGQGEV
jgi:hypothetical protein